MRGRLSTALLSLSYEKDPLPSPPDIELKFTSYRENYTRQKPLAEKQQVNPEDSRV